MGSKTWRCNVAQNSITRMHSRAAATVPLALKMDDVVEMFVAPELRDMCHAVPQYFRAYGSPWANTHIQLENHIRFGARVELIGNNPPALPLKHDPHFAHPGFEILREYAAAQYEILKQWSLVRETFDALWDICDGNPAQIRFFWPSLLVVFDHSFDDELQKIANEIRTAKTPRKVVSLPSWLTTACRETAGTLAAWSLLPEIEPSNREVRVQFDGVPSWTFEGETIPARV